MKNLKMGVIKTKTIEVLNFIKDNPNCNTDNIRSGLNMPHQTATAIISNLLDIALIVYRLNAVFKNFCEGIL